MVSLIAMLHYVLQLVSNYMSLLFGAEHAWRTEDF